MEQNAEINKKPLTKARIKGIPVWHLKGVTTDNVPVIKSTEMWVHYPWLGNDGWYLAVPDPMREAAEGGLGQQGLKLSGVSELPTRSNFLFGLGMVLCCFSVPFVAGLSAETDSSTDLGTLIFLSIFAFIIAMVLRSKSGAQYGALVAPANGGRGDSFGNDRSSSDSVPRYVGSLSGTGTTEHGLYAD